MFKKPRSYGAASVIVLVLSLLIFPEQTYAYLDPGSNSYLFQMAVASFLGIVFTVKVFFKRISDFVRNLLLRNAKKNNSAQ